MDLEEIYQEFTNDQLEEQQYSPGMFWHGSPEKGLRCIKAFASGDETVSLAWVSNAFEYAEQFASRLGYVYHIRQTDRLNIWNPRADKDWNDLIKKYPEYNVDNARNFLKSYDWVGLEIFNIGKMRMIDRNDLLEAIQSLGYNGVFNRESFNKKPAVGIFNKFVRSLRVFDTYAWDEATKLWRSVSHPNRAYDLKKKSIVSVKNS